MSLSHPLVSVAQDQRPWLSGILTLLLLVALAGCSSDDTPVVDAVPLSQIDLVFQEVAELDRPLTFAANPKTGGILIGERTGQVFAYEPPDASSESLVPISPEPYLDLRDEVGSVREELGLLGLAISPDGSELYANYTVPDLQTRVARWDLSEGALDATSGSELFRLDQPFAAHNGGQLAFGPDGFLYVSIGDGGDNAELAEGAQDPSTLYGSIIRVEVEQGQLAPAEGNPFVGTDGDDRVFVYGLRNSWRFSFDRQTGDMWIGDVGQNKIEEINLLEAPELGAGSNLGWNWMEGTHSRNNRPEPDDHHPPVFEYTHEDGCAVIGGYVYRGSAIPELTGAYLYGDLCVSEVRALRVHDGQVINSGAFPLPADVEGIWSFAEDARGEIYVLMESGQVLRIEAR